MSFYSNRQSTIQNQPASAQHLVPISKSFSHMLSSLPSDSISHLCWSNPPQSNFLSSGSWDGTVRIWEIGENFGGVLIDSHKCTYNVGSPVLTSCFSDSNQYLFAGGCNNTVQMYDLGSGNKIGQQIAQHDKPVCKVLWSSFLKVLITGSWDGYVRMWDGKSSNPVWQYKTDSKIFTMDLKKNILVATDSQRNIYAWSLENLQNEKKLCSQMKAMSRSISLFPEIPNIPYIPGVAVGSIEGRCSILTLEEKKNDKSFTFRCHRNERNIYAVNGVDFHLRFGSLATCGSDGVIALWDKDNRQRLRNFENLRCPVVDFRFNPSGSNLCAYALSYDWHMGCNRNLIQSCPNQIYVHMLKDDVLRGKPKKK